jgi:hypothetical protein
VPVSEKARALLRYNQGECGTWQDANGSRWQAYYFRWLPGRAWVHLVNDHNPGICLPAVGRELRSISATEPLEVNGLRFRFSVYRFSAGNDVAYVFYSVSEDGAKEPRPPVERVTAKDRLASVWQGRRNPGQRVLEVAVWGISDQKQAEAALAEQLTSLLARE